MTCGRSIRWSVILLALLAAAGAAQAQVYKCTDSAGRTTYADAPCDSKGKPLKLPSDPKRSATNPHVCAQLLDERHRLAAEVERDVRRGRAESNSSAKRREALTRQYEARCVGIRRSDPKSK